MGGGTGFAVMPAHNLNCSHFCDANRDEADDSLSPLDLAWTDRFPKGLANSVNPATAPANHCTCFRCNTALPVGQSAVNTVPSRRRYIRPHSFPSFATTRSSTSLGVIAEKL